MLFATRPHFSLFLMNFKIFPSSIQALFLFFDFTSRKFSIEKRTYEGQSWFSNSPAWVITPKNSCLGKGIKYVQNLSVVGESSNPTAIQLSIQFV
jgi:hypothetical protein